MSNPIDTLKKMRGGHVKPRAHRIETDDIPVKDLGLDKNPSPEEVYEFFQTGERTDPDGKEYPAYALPKKWNKSKLPDYRPGKVKTYTRQEIKDYEKSKEDKDNTDS